MIHIDTSEIKKPGLHLDELGYTFLWKGHFLRGIYPEAVKQVNDYFNSGFIGEIVRKGLFPNTVISEYENEQFGLILEHELISPVIYASEWNPMMLKDAAIMVIKIAIIAKKYGYNMIDCHKMNVLFNNNHPEYVDLGSFIPEEPGITGWKPFTSFLRSYYYILDVWKDGAKQISKRMMAPGNEFSSFDYYLYKSFWCKKIPYLAKKKVTRDNILCDIASAGEKRIDEILDSHNIPFKDQFRKWMVSLSKSHIFPSQRIQRYSVKISKMEFMISKRSTAISSKLNVMINLLNNLDMIVRSVLFVDYCSPETYIALLEKTSIDRIITICQDESDSNSEYTILKSSNQNISCVNSQLLNNSLLSRDPLPEERFKADVVVVKSDTIISDTLSLHNLLVLLLQCKLFSYFEIVIVDLPSTINKSWIKELEDNYLFLTGKKMYVI